MNVSRGRLARWRVPLAVGVPTAAIAGIGALVLHHLPVRQLTLHEAEAILLLTAVLATVALLPAVWAAGRAPALPVVLGGADDAAADVGALRPDELEHAAALHAEALSAGFLVGLGHRFVMAYHRTFVDSPHAVAVAARLDGVLVGMLLGVTDPVAHRRWLRRHRALRLARMGTLALLARPRATVRFARTRMPRYWRALRGAERPGPGADEAAERDVRAPAVLSHVAALRGARGLGIGEALVEAFLRSAGASGALRARLATVAGEDGAGGFYRRLGWELEATVVDADGRSVELFDLGLAPRGGPSR